VQECPEGAPLRCAAAKKLLDSSTAVTRAVRADENWFGVVDGVLLLLAG